MARIGLALLLVASLSAAAAVPIPSQTRGGLPVLPKRGGGKKVDTKVVVKPAPAPARAPASASAASNIKWAGVATVLGGALAHLALGSLYCFANFQSYLPKHLLFLDGADRAGQPDAQYVFPLTLVAQCLGLPLGPMFQRSIGERSTLLLGGFLMATGVLLASYAKTLPVFMLFYSMLFGIGVGIGYTAPIVAGWKWFPQSKGLVSGAVLTGFGAGGFFFTKLGTAIINPSNEKPVNGFFPPSVTNGFGSLLRKLSLAYYALSILGSLLVSVPPPAPAPAKGTPAAAPAVDYTPAQALTSTRFWWLWVIIFLISSGSLSTAGINKTYGLQFPELRSDAYLSTVLALSALFNGGGRLFWGTMSDKLGFKKAFAGLSGLQALTLALYDKVPSSRLTFALATMSIFFTLGGQFAMFPPVVTQTFGPRNGVTIYSYMFTAFALSSILGSVLAGKLVKLFGGYDPVFKVFAAAAAGALVLNQVLPDSK